MAALIVAAGFLVSAGLFGLDELVYYAGSKTLLANGSFVIENGLPQFQSDDLRLGLFVEGPHGLVPQYPAGHAVLGATFLWLFGERGLMMMNVLAGAGTIFALRALAERLFRDRAAARLSVVLFVGATFWLEYVYAVWPHSVAILSVTLALLWTLDCLDAQTDFAVKAISAGTAIGLGFLMRTDTILALPAIGLIVWHFAKHPFSILMLAGTGFLPFAAFTSAANFVKFGSLNPLSYGQSVGGGTNLASHIVPIAVLAVISLVIFCSRFVAWRPGKRDYVIGLGVAAMALLLSHAARDFVQDYLRGAWALVVDATTIPDRRNGMTEMPGGLLLFWGHWKKALGQSMPWLGLLFLAVHQPADKHARRSQLIVMVLAAIWTLPFFLRSWHGGMGNDMRYFLPVIPALCAVSAKLLLDFARSVPQAWRSLVVGPALCGCALVLWTIYHPTHLAGAQQILSTYLFLALALIALLAGVRWAGQEQMRFLCLSLVGAGLAASAAFLAVDFARTQHDRAGIEKASTVLEGLPDRALVYASPQSLSRWAFEPGHILALPSGPVRSIDHALVDSALDRNYRVLVSSPIAREGLRQHYEGRLEKLDDQAVTASGAEFWEIRPAAD